MNVIKAMTGEMDGKPCVWVEDKDGVTKRLGVFDDEECYETFLKCVEAGITESMSWWLF